PPRGMPAAASGVPGEELGARPRSRRQHDHEAVRVRCAKNLAEVHHPQRRTSSAVEGHDQRPTFGRWLSGWQVGIGMPQHAVVIEFVAIGSQSGYLWHWVDRDNPATNVSLGASLADSPILADSQ